MNKKLILLFNFFVSSFLGAAAPKNALHTVMHVESSALCESLGAALSKANIGVTVDYKALGESLAQMQLNLKMDNEALGKALSQAQLNCCPKQIQEILASKEVKEALENFKLVPTNYTINPIHFRLDQVPQVPIDLALKLSAENGRRIAATATITGAAASMLYAGVGCTNGILLAGGCVALDPEGAQRAASMLCNQYTYQQVANCCATTKKHTLQIMGNHLNHSKKPSYPEVKRN